MERKYYASFTPDKYYDTSYLQLYIEGKLGKTIEEIEDDIKNAQVYVNKDRINEFLNLLFMQENEKLFWKFYGKKVGYNVDETKRLNYLDKMKAEHFKLDLAQIRYYENYLSILREKLILMLKIINGITVRENKEITDEGHKKLTDYLEELDIELSKSDKELEVASEENKDAVVKEDYLAGRILGSDIIRLVRPFIYLYNDLMKKTKEANDLLSYYVWDRSDHVKIGKYTPDYRLQAPNEYSERFGNDAKGFIPYTEKQKTMIKKTYNENLKKVIDIVTGL